jgi:alpha-glucosidase (family GH31 glycosyl hydrolase)
MWHSWEGGETCTGLWWECPRERGHLKDQGVDGIRMDITEIDWGGG